MPGSPGLPSSLVTFARLSACVAGLAVLSACAGTQAPPLTATQEAAIYKSKAKANYTPPGPPGDPWGPYVTEASRRFDVPDTWVREVMHVESGGYQFRADGALTTSPVGAMGLMQLMPETYDEVRARYNLGDDAFDPHNNILAGTAYIREMYDAFGSPGFLAAYNAGPARLEDYLTHNRPLPDETRRYVFMIGNRISGSYPQSRSPAEQLAVAFGSPGFLAAYNAGPARLEDYLTHNRPLPDETRRYVFMIGNRISGSYPQSRSPAEQLAVNQIPIDIPAGPRYRPRPSYALAARERRRHEASVRYAALERRAGKFSHAVPPPVEVAEAPEPRAMRVAYAAPAHHGGLHFISPAMASEAMPHGGSSWGIQVGAYGNPGQAQAAAGAARGMVGHAGTVVMAVHSGHATLYRARLSGMTHEKAVQACQRMARSHGGCLIVSPASS